MMQEKIKQYKKLPSYTKQFIHVIEHKNVAYLEFKIICTRKESFYSPETWQNQKKICNNSTANMRKTEWLFLKTKGEGLLTSKDLIVWRNLKKDCTLETWQI